jgi:arylsulfatase A-like enzyme
MKHPLSITAALLLPLAVLHAAQPLNILFFTSDDMNHDSTAVFGGPIKDLTPHVDRLAAEGLRFEHAYSTVAVCQPVRQTMFCGLYPHRSGSMGFFSGQTGSANAQSTTARRRLPHLPLRQGQPPPSVGTILLRCGR